MSTTSTPTPDLRDGDIVRHYGMRLEITNHHRAANHPSPNVYAATGIVLNLDEVRAAQVVPVGWMDTDVQGRRTWTIQGNALATWGVEH